MNKSRRSFLKNVALGTSGVIVGAPLISKANIINKSFNAPLISKGNVIGANERVRVAIMGVNSRGTSLARTFAQLDKTEVVYICDVDQNAIPKGVKAVQSVTGKSPKAIEDFRHALDDKDIDALVIAAPDHWHAPATILACNAGKNVFVEKPCSHNPNEGEMMIKAARQYNKLVQMGSQRRSWRVIQEAMNLLHDGIIGNVYFAKSWYANNRKSIGIGKSTPVPKNLNYDLWQGPAPSLPYKDNLIHYNWHWNWHWGTGEALNNGTHEVDLIRWGFDVDFATKVSSTGGRYHYSDDWETPDTQVINFEFGNDKSAMWEGRSCNGRPVEGSGRGVVFYGTEGTMFTDGGNKFQIFDKANKLIKEIKEGEDIDVLDTTSPSGNLDTPHCDNFIKAVQNRAKLTADIETGHKSTLLCQLGNIAQRTRRILHIDQTNGHIINDPEAMRLWKREYDPTWIF